MILSEYTLHTFSLHRAMVKDNDPNVQEDKLLAELAQLEQHADVQKGILLPEENYHEVKAYMTQDLREKDTVYIFVRNREKQNIVGVIGLTNHRNLKEEYKGPRLEPIYVLPLHRRKGILTAMVTKALEVGEKMEYEYILTEPILDGKAQRVFERFGFENVSVDDQEIVLKKNLRPRSPEGQHPRLRR